MKDNPIFLYISSLQAECLKYLYYLSAYSQFIILQYGMKRVLKLLAAFKLHRYCQ